MKEPTIIRAHDSHVSDVLFAPDCRTLVSAGMDNTVKLWTVPSWELTRTFEGHENSADALSFSADCQIIAGGTEYEVLLWSVEEGALLEELALAEPPEFGDTDRGTAHWFRRGAPDGTA